ncbi:MAG: ATP-binding protein [Thermoflavifilum sp.]|nr:ATP-binding protein [Thermoflavifilum sp.]MCL6513663.1 ATP-binding protein [Alicyclobacillus sp.]
MASVFPVGRIVEPPDLVDRSEFVGELRQRLLDGQSLMIAGPRRIGKSSLAREVLRQVREAGAYTAKVDLFYVTSVEEFASKFLQSILENRVGVIAQATRAMEGVRKLLSRAEIRAKLHDLELGITLGNRDADPLELLETAVMTAERLAARDGRRMVVLLDEFQEIDRLGGEPLLKRLRALFQEQSHTVYLFLGSQTTLMQTIFADRRQAFYRFAAMMVMPPIPENAWRDYVFKRFMENGMRLTETGFRLLYERTGGHPYCMMAVAYNALVYANLQGLQHVTADVMDFAYEQALSQLQAIYDVQWQELHRFKHADAVLMALVNGTRPYTLPLSRSQVAQGLEYLMRLSVIERGEGRGEYKLVEPMFGEWLKRKQEL